jgi:hypothetical protein
MDGMFFKGAVVGGIAGTLFAAATVRSRAPESGACSTSVRTTRSTVRLLRGNTGGNPQLRVSNQQGGDGAVGVFGIHSAGAGKAAGVQGDTASAAAGAVAVFGRTTSG